VRKIKNIGAVLALLVLVAVQACTGQKDPYIEFIKQERREDTKSFLNAETTPLTDKDRATFLGLDYFTVDESYKVKAKVTKLPREISFSMKTTTDRLPEYMKAAKLEFQLKGKDYSLIAYRSKDHPEEGWFIPFTDLTNGVETYEVGRYIDIDLQETIKTEIDLDFNLCYNPYCAYAAKWSCPIPPPENNLKIRIEAGVKKFH